MLRRFSHVIGIDDAPFARAHRGDVLVVGAVFAGLRLDGVVADRVQRDGSDSTEAVARMVQRSRFVRQLQLVLLQGVAFAGFNVVDLPALALGLGLPVLVIARRPPDLAAIRRALLGHVPDGALKWALVERAGPMEPVAGVQVQRAGLTLDEAAAIIARLAINGRVPEPLRIAHLIAGGVTLGESHGRA